MRSDIDSNSEISPGKFGGGKPGSSMKGIFTHTDNLKESLQKKIEQKERIMEQRARGIDIPLRNRIHATKASELRSQSVMTNKKLTEIDRNLDAMKMNKAFKNDASFSMIEKEKQRLNKVFQLPPIARMQSV